MVSKTLRDLIEEARNLDWDDNYTDIRHWIKVKNNAMDSFNYSMVKGSKAHFISYINGVIYRSDMHRSRTGYWKNDVNHLASVDGYINNKSMGDAFLKYVRGLGYIYREYLNLERLDYISENDGSLHIQLISDYKAKVRLKFEIGHTRAWPSCDVFNKIDVKIAKNTVYISSNISKTVINVLCSGNTKIDSYNNFVYIDIESFSDAEIIVSDSDVYSDDIDDTLNYHNIIEKTVILETPDFEFNKLFLWAKHDILEFYSETKNGSGWFAGFPVYSWFFGRDGLWMALAANQIGLTELTLKHMRLLFKYSDKGRIPHEIGLGNIMDQNYSINNTKFNTMYMSIDSSLLWLLVNESVKNWYKSDFDDNDIKNVLDFLYSCDSDNDLLLENDFMKGLIGWPETWANIRNGKTVDINALWIEVLKYYRNDEYDYALKRYVSLFFNEYMSIDFIDSKAHEIKSAMQFVPGIFLMDQRISKRLRDLIPGMFTPWGLRSMSVYDEMYDGGYHTGTVWPLMTGWFVLSAYNNGLKDEAFNALKTFVNAAFSANDPGRINETYDPVSFTPTGQFAQGWSSSMFVLSLMQGMLNINSLDFKPENFECKNIPESWDYVKIHNLIWRDKFYDVYINHDYHSIIEIKMSDVNEDNR
ncbi:Glycogen debranching enzyme (alpha-1,6-glucosidase) [Picrophilus oshimae DSM 9789]|uniref:Glycogen debranching enzyme (Alpha-1,6-glucosidase) n=1 Tax=Picrophilus torridus (strain ATCC 700027 / DSM 9790 / JCM 10055 / NBRC 100828 / KAW 2/3) TaxID=1122961 RepID=A0A8G2FW37_PICTO|nr:Glycogen debranching enzyme (alpha-1,6-glucosidase) [Picrophilus oshimae DSM 9789]